MSWYKFWKRAGPMQIYSEDYVWLLGQHYPNEENIKLECESWAESTPGGHNTHYKYGYNQITNPPKEVIRRKLSETRRRKNSILEQEKFLEAELKRK